MKIVIRMDVGDDTGFAGMNDAEILEYLRGDPMVVFESSTLETIRAPTGPTVCVRAAVAMGEGGRYCVHGNSGASDAALQFTAEEWPDGQGIGVPHIRVAHHCFIEASVPAPPEPVTVEAEVVD